MNTKQSDAKRRMTNAALCNLALGAAFATAPIFSWGSKILWAFGFSGGFRHIAPHQGQTLLALASYWIPAVLFYVLVRLTRLDYWLRPTRRIHTSILIANLLLLLYLVIRISASTIPGGGAGFAVALMSPILIFPAWAVLAYGFVTLFYKSIHSDEVLRPMRQRFTQADAGLVVLALLIPTAVFLRYLLPR